jgi:hypothetical protein
MDKATRLFHRGEKEYVADHAGTAISAIPLRQYQPLLQESLATSGNWRWTPSPQRNNLILMENSLQTTIL